LIQFLGLVLKVLHSTMSVTRRTSQAKWLSTSSPASLWALRSSRQTTLCKARRTSSSRSLWVRYSDAFLTQSTHSNSYTAAILSSSLSNQLQAEFVNFRNIYEYREKQSKMYSWVPLVTSSLVSFFLLAGSFHILTCHLAGRTPVQHLWFCHVLLLLVLDCRSPGWF
jgi:hypothetical protein